MEWILVKGGEFIYGDNEKHKTVKDMLWTKTLVTREDAGFLQDNKELPITMISYFEAVDFAKQFNSSLPSSVEWEWMAGGPERRKYPWGHNEYNLKLGNTKFSNICCATPVWNYLDGATPEGILDVAGNVWEWTLSSVPHGAAIIRGGSYNSLPLYCQTKFLNAAPKETRSKGIGLRLIKYV